MRDRLPRLSQRDLVVGISLEDAVDHLIEFPMIGVLERDGHTTFMLSAEHMGAKDLVRSPRQDRARHTPNPVEKNLAASEIPGRQRPRD